MGINFLQELNVCEDSLQKQVIWDLAVIIFTQEAINIKKQINMSESKNICLFEIISIS